MGKKKIEHPKVFISYAWGDSDYQEKVLSFATQLMSDGIDVVLDKWDLTEGNDTYAFMEKCATDDSITNVLMLLDPIYAKKADEHTGGVGTETQIISAKVYQEVTQDKFIPIVFARDENDNVCKPTYLAGRLHFDLSQAESYDETYQRLVITLFGEEVYAKPELGLKPGWVEKKTVIPVKTKTEFGHIKKLTNVKEKQADFKNYLMDIKNEILRIVNDESVITLEADNIIAEYERFMATRGRYFELIKVSSSVDESEKAIASFLEKLHQEIGVINNYRAMLCRTFLHELFLSTIAFFVKNEDYNVAGYLLGKTYFESHSYHNTDLVDGFHIFYSGAEDILGNAVKVKNKQNYYSGEAAYWTQNVDSAFCTKEDFVLADLICFNYSIYGNEYIGGHPWFPMTYVYDNTYSSVIREMSKKLISREYVEQVLPLFGYSTIAEFKTAFANVEADRKQGKYRDYRYQQAWDPAVMIGDFIEVAKIGTYR